MNFKVVTYWGVGAVALVALAGTYPNVATAFVSLLIIGVLLTHYKDFVAIIPGL